MSIRPEFANAILTGEKGVEFRKRPVADDVSFVLIYATLPVGSLIGWCVITGQSTTSPKKLWDRFKNVSGISKDKFFDYYHQRNSGTGIMVSEPVRFNKPIPLTDLSDHLRPPQSFQYLTEEQSQRFFELTGHSNPLQQHYKAEALF